MCSPVAASVGMGAVSAIGGAMQSRAANKAAKRDYEYRLKVRENKWMRRRTDYKTKQVQYQSNLSEANIAAQRAYSQSQTSLNNIRSKAFLDHEEDFKSVLKAEGAIEASAAERGIRGASIQKMKAMNLAELGRANRARERALTMSRDAYFEHNAGIARQLRSRQNQLYSSVAISPVPDTAPPKPVMQNVGSQLFLGLARTGFDAAGTYYANKPS